MVSYWRKYAFMAIVISGCCRGAISFSNKPIALLSTPSLRETSCRRTGYYANSFNALGKIPLDPIIVNSVATTTQLAMASDPDPSILISSKGELTQWIAFFSAFAVLAVGTSLCVQLWHGPAIDLLGAQFYEEIRSTIFPIAFGSIFAIVGLLHFVFDENFVRIVPPKGTWGGLWQVPAPGMETLGITYEEYHCYWSGVAECVGGLWLLLAAVGTIPTSTEIPAFLLFLLTVSVTPANLYMFTHDAHPGGAIPKLDYPFGHIARFVVQCGLLSNFWIMANP